MGLCCSSRASSYIGEDYVHTIIDDKKFKFQYYDYFKLFNLILDKRQENCIQKSLIKKEILPLLIEEKDNNFLKYHNAITNEILNKLQDKSNIYEVLFYFYPLINHKNEKTNETLFMIISYISGGELKFKEFKQCLIKYFEFCTKNITYAIWSNLPQNEIKDSLDELNTQVFTDNNITKAVMKLIEPLNKKFKDEDVIDMEIVNEVYKMESVANYVNVRELMICNYGEK
jgi:hypothetical protein